MPVFKLPKFETWLNFFLDDKVFYEDEDGNKRVAPKEDVPQKIQYRFEPQPKGNLK